jgi:hypothetical protein
MFVNQNAGFSSFQSPLIVWKVELQPNIVVACGTYAQKFGSWLNMLR